MGNEIVFSAVHSNALAKHTATFSSAFSPATSISLTALTTAEALAVVL